jgi:anti-sigma factor RsiW
MSPDKLFDYLDGKLSPEQREKVEQQLTSDAHARRELAAAREIHSHMRDSREVLLLDELPNPRGAILGRRVAIAFAVLVFLNVVFGLYAIGFMKKKERARPAETQNQQLVQALEKAAVSAMPTPSLEIDEIKLEAPAKQREAMASKIIAAASQSGGSAVKGLNNENGILLFAEIPIERGNDFRDSLKKLGAVLPAPRTENATSGKAILQIRIVESVK